MITQAKKLLKNGKTKAVTATMVFAASPFAMAVQDVTGDISTASTTNNANQTAAVAAVVALAFFSMGLGMLISIIKR